MRVISQDGTIDVPYDYFSLSMTKAKIVSGMVEDRCVFSIFCNNLLTQSTIKVAEYSTEEKAIKAMEMLREQYSRIEIIKALASGTCEHMEESLKPEELKDILEKYINMEVFQFPQDDDERLN